MSVYSYIHGSRETQCTVLLPIALLLSECQEHGKERRSSFSLLFQDLELIFFTLYVNFDQCPVIQDTFVGWKLKYPVGIDGFIYMAGLLSPHSLLCRFTLKAKSSRGLGNLPT